MTRRALATAAATAALTLVPGAAVAATSGTETVTTAVGAGTLTITTGGPVDLGRAKLDPGNEVLVARGDLGTVRVTDTRGLESPRECGANRGYERLITSICPTLARCRRWW